MLITRCRPLLLLLLLVFVWNTLGVAPENGVNNEDDPNQIHMAATLDSTAYEWLPSLIEYTVMRLNQDTDNDISMTSSFHNSECDEVIATRAYWAAKVLNGNIPPHAALAARCSGATIAVSHFTSLELVPQISPFALSGTLSDKTKYPLFSRVVSPDGVKALASMFRMFGWKRVVVLSTNTRFSQDLRNQFQDHWVGEHLDEDGTSWNGEVANTDTIQLLDDGTVDHKSVKVILNNLDKSADSRIIAVMSHHEHIRSILQVANEMNFRPDTVWAGPESWAARADLLASDDWAPPFPGLLGVTSFRQKTSAYQDYLQDYKEWYKQRNGTEPFEDFPIRAPETVDAITALYKAFAATPPEHRRNGTIVTENLRNLTFEGLSGSVNFTDEGDRKNPRYSIVNMQPQSDGSYAWVPVGETSITYGSAELYPEEVVCHASRPCAPASTALSLVSDVYPGSGIITKIPTAVLVVIPVIGFLFVLAGGLYWRQRRRKDAYKTIVQKTEKIDIDLEELDNQEKEIKKKKASLIKERAELNNTPPGWSFNGEVAVEVQPEDPQYWDVLEKMRLTMKDAHISKLWRIENEPLWAFYCFHKNRIMEQTNQENIVEEEVFHGTSDLEPAVIYKDEHDGFMVNYAAHGFWGRGIYFAENASYSDHYAFKPSLRASSRASQPEEREMFLCKLLVGNAKPLDRDSSLIAPPWNPDTNNKYRYHTVTGHTGNSQVYVVYENGRAYPEFLVRYYRGKQVPARSPYNTREESIRNGAPQRYATDIDSAESGLTEASPTDEGLDVLHTTTPVWEYLNDNSDWVQYDPLHQVALEQRYDDLKSEKTIDPNVIIHTDDWRYEVDIDSWTQTNMDHQLRSSRDIRRRTE